MQWRYDNTNDFFSVDIGQFISDRSIDIADITEAIYMVKVNRSDADVDALVTLTIGAGITKIPAAGAEPDKLAITFSPADFGVGKLEVNPCDVPAYYTGIGIKTAAMAKFLEAGLVDDRLTIFDHFILD